MRFNDGQRVYQQPPSRPSVSIVICTNNRAGALRNVLRSLEYLDYGSSSDPNHSGRFEVCVVYGPSDDGTSDVLAQYRGRIKTAPNPTRNLSVSRNIGIALAAGNVVAFLDDDSIPEPEWLTELMGAYDDPDVGGAGGFVYDHTGMDFQARYVTADRLGQAEHWTQPVTLTSIPFSAKYPHLLGANSSFRRDALLAIGGFDEEYDYFLDETDVCVRLIDAGWVIETVTGACVHHKLLPGSVRIMEQGVRVLRSWRSIFKNKIYFALCHRGNQLSMNEIIDHAQYFIKEQAHHMRVAVGAGLLEDEDATRFWQEVDEAWTEAWTRWVAGDHKFMRQETIDQWAQPFLPFDSRTPEGGRRTLCYVSQEITPGKMGGIGRYTHELAHSMAAMGHHVHVIAKADDVDYVDFQDGVWIHWLLNTPADTAAPAGLQLPPYIWDRAVTVAHALDAINAKRPITVVCAPIWDCEGLAALAEGRYPLVTMLQTSMASFLESNPSRAKDKKFVRSIANPIIAAETHVMLESPFVITPTLAIQREMEVAYHLTFDPDRLTRIPYCIGDWRLLPFAAPEALPLGSLRLVFVGRLEERKGIDVLLSAAKHVLARHPHVYLDLVGNDTIPGPGGRTFRDLFDHDSAADAIRSRVRFHGSVSDEHLRGFYRASDAIVTPSRFESFGLMLVEGMMFSKPVIGCNAGGMVEVVEDGVTGLLAQPGDQASLEACMNRLIEDAALRERMGAAARRRFEQRFHADRVAQQVLAVFLDTAERWQVANELKRLSAALGVDNGTASGTRAAVRQTPLVEPTGSKAAITIVAPMLAFNDAISAAVRDTYLMLSQDPRFEVIVLSARCDFPDVRSELVASVRALITNPHFLAADVLIYPFGFANPIFDALICGNGHARQIVRFHNITPEQFVPPSMAREIRESFRMIDNLVYADAIWADSQVNREVLEEYGIHSDRIEVVPLAVYEPQVASLKGKRRDALEYVFMGRAVPSKGLLDLVQAFERVHDSLSTPVRLRFVGSLEYANHEYLDMVKRFVRDHDLESSTQFCGAVSDQTREQIYHESHILAIPSYHEGFCKPVVEGLRAGCIPVGYQSYNLPYIADGFGRLVPPGDINALAAALIEVSEGIVQAQAHPNMAVLPLDRGRLTLNDFEAQRLSYIEQFTFDRLAAVTQDRVSSLLASAPRGPTGVTPSRKILATIGVGPLAEVLAYVRPSLEAYARRHGYELVIGDGNEAEGRPLPWAKIGLMRHLLQEAHDVLWVDADALILDETVDIADELAPEAFQALVRHATQQGEIPNTGVWYLRGQRARLFLDEVWQLDQYRDHPWWEQAAVQHLLGYSATIEADQPVRASTWMEGTQWLDPSWNAVTPEIPLAGARIRHYAGWSVRGLNARDLIALMRQEKAAWDEAAIEDYHRWPDDRALDTLQSIYQRIVARDGCRIKYGPFAGMTYLPHVDTADLRRGSAFVPKLIGAYEAEPRCH